MYFEQSLKKLHKMFPLAVQIYKKLKIKNKEIYIFYLTVFLRYHKKA